MQHAGHGKDDLLLLTLLKYDLQLNKTLGIICNHSHAILPFFFGGEGTQCFGLGSGEGQIILNPLQGRATTSWPKLFSV